MDLKKALDKITCSLKNGDFNYSKHFKDMMNDRYFEDKFLKKIIKSNELVSFEKQNKNLYKLIYYLNEQKDLILIINIGFKVKLVTIYKTDNGKRIRENEE